MSDASAAPNSGKQELMHYVHLLSSHLPPLDAADASDTIDTACDQNNKSFWIPPSFWLLDKSPTFKSTI